MKNYELDDEIKKLSWYVYHNGEISIPAGWVSLESAKNDSNGFYAETFYKDGKVVIVYRGTDTNVKKPMEILKDSANDVIMMTKVLPWQKEDAEKYYYHIANKYKKYELVIGGHSLGGSLAQIIGTITGARTVTYNALGVGRIKGLKPKYTENITNYGNSRDIVFNKKLDDHIGKIMVIDDDVSTKVRVGKRPYVDLSLNKKHSIKDMGNIRNAQEYIPNDEKRLVLHGNVIKSVYEPLQDGRLSNAQRIEQRLRDEWASALEEKGADSTKVNGVFAKAADEEISGKKAAKRDFLREELESDALENERFVLSASSKMDEEKFEKVASLDDYVNKVSGNNKIFTREDIDYMSAEDYKKNVKAIKYQREKIGIPTDKQADNAVKSGGMVYVHSYTRGDGVEVQAYYRARPSR